MGAELQGSVTTKRDGCSVELDGEVYANLIASVSYKTKKDLCPVCFFNNDVCFLSSVWRCVSLRTSQLLHRVLLHVS